VLAAEGGVSSDADGETPGAKQPTAGELVDGWVAGIKPYGLFVDLPTYGHRTRALVPHEETGERRGTDLTKRFRIGDQLRVEILDVDAEGKIRASMTRVQERVAEQEFQSYRAETAPHRQPQTAMADALRRALEGEQKRSS
jgi:small subunit ribosomal protein S1